jgi:hypothetical protein
LAAVIFCSFGSKNAEVLVFFEWFFPVTKFARAQMLELNFINPCYSLRFLAAWLWSPFGGVFFICPYLDFLIASFSFRFLGMLSSLLLSSFDTRTVKAFRGFPCGVPESALEKGKHDFPNAAILRQTMTKLTTTENRKFPHRTNSSNWRSKTNCTSRAS